MCTGSAGVAELEDGNAAVTQKTVGAVVAHTWEAEAGRSL